MKSVTIVLALLAICNISNVNSECMESAICHTAKRYIWNGLLHLIHHKYITCPKMELLPGFIEETIKMDEQMKIVGCIDHSDHCTHLLEQVTRCVQWWLTPTACHFREPSITCGEHAVCSFDEKELQCVYQPEICRLLDRWTEAVISNGHKHGKLTIVKHTCQELVEKSRCHNLQDDHMRQVLLLTRETCGWGIKKDRKWTCKQVKCYNCEMPKIA